MSSPPYGYRYGPRQIIAVEIDSSSSAIVAGDFLSVATAGYLQQASAGEIAVAVAVDSCASPSADGGAVIRADFSRDSVYEFPPDTGTVTQALKFASMDVGGPQSVDIDASTDNALDCVDVDTTANTVFVQLSKSTQLYTGVTQ